MQMNAVRPLSRWLGGTGQRWLGTSMMDSGRQLREDVIRMLRDGRGKVVFERGIGFGEVVEGYKIVGSGRARGKVVVKVGCRGMI